MLRRVLVCSAALVVALGVSLGASAPAHAEESGTGYLCAGVIITGTVNFDELQCIPVTNWGTTCVSNATELLTFGQLVVAVCVPKLHPGA